MESECLPKWGRVTVIVLLDPVSSFASLCTSTLAGLKSSRYYWNHESFKVRKMMDVAIFVLDSHRDFNLHFKVWKADRALGLVKLAPSFSSLTS